MPSPPPPLPARVGPCEFGMLGAMVAVRCPQEFADIILRAGGLWEPGSRRWLVERRASARDPRAPAGDRPAVPARRHVAGLGWSKSDCLSANVGSLVVPGMRVTERCGPIASSHDRERRMAPCHGRDTGTGHQG